MCAGLRRHADQLAGSGAGAPEDPTPVAKSLESTRGADTPVTLSLMPALIRVA